MAKVIGNCRLCLASNVALRDSHIVSKWSYRRIHERHLPNPNPVRVVNGEARQVSDQVTEYLLCSDCEQALGRDESYVARITKSELGKLPELSRLIGTVRVPDGEMMVAPVHLLDVDKFIRFAIGVIWKGHVATVVRYCDLGSTLPEAFRQYLLLGTPLPTTVNMTAAYVEEAHLNNLSRGLLGLMQVPETTQWADCYSHSFVVAGLRFVCAESARIESGFQRYCLIHSSAKGIHVAPHTYWAGLSQYVLGAQPKGKLAEAKKRWARGGKVDT